MRIKGNATGSDAEQTLHVVLKLRTTTNENEGYGYAETVSQIIAKKYHAYAAEKLKKLSGAEIKDSYDDAERELREIANLGLAATDAIVDTARKEKQLGEELENAAKDADTNGNEGNAAVLDLLAVTMENAAQKTWRLGEKAVEVAGVAGFIADAAETWEGVKHEFGEIFHNEHGTQQNNLSAVISKTESAPTTAKQIESSTLTGLGNYLAKTAKGWKDYFEEETGPSATGDHTPANDTDETYTSRMLLDL